jgi:hypothetical protein
MLGADYCADMYPRRKKPSEAMLLEGFLRAGERVRTVDIQLGRLTLYQLSYTREGDYPL